MAAACSPSPILGGRPILEICQGSAYQDGETAPSLLSRWATIRLVGEDIGEDALRGSGRGRAPRSHQHQPGRRPSRRRDSVRHILPTLVSALRQGPSSPKGILDRVGEGSCQLKFGMVVFLLRPQAAVYRGESSYAYPVAFLLELRCRSGTRRTKAVDSEFPFPFIASRPVLRHPYSSDTRKHRVLSRTQRNSLSAATRRAARLMRTGNTSSRRLPEALHRLPLFATRQRQCAYVGDFLRHYGDALQAKPARQSPLACFQRGLGLWNPLNARLPPGEFNCCHVTFTPTRLLLEGPYPIQSNRVIRQYSGHEEHFIRVDFRDEDMLQYRWDRAVDGASFVRERVGPTLKEGFELGGRRFEFLAYSSSALREHAVWFMNPFQDEQTGRWVTSEAIRQAQGDFNDLGNKKFYLLDQPSKYAARLAQAFTATDPSVDLRRYQWQQVEDIASPAEAVFTDGCGTISHSLAVMIWAALLVAKRVHENATMSTIFQIRFLGYKGVVSVDRNLDKRKDGVLMLLRDSMHKFKHPLRTTMTRQQL
ncbi:RdRP-domain-containing protein [Salix suchowensis]|nr:RdRP-domain-containing protein [Salix suchowensis]